MHTFFFFAFVLVVGGVTCILFIFTISFVIFLSLALAQMSLHFGMLRSVCAWLEETELNFKLVGEPLGMCVCVFLVGKLLPFYVETMEKWRRRGKRNLRSFICCLVCFVDFSDASAFIRLEFICTGYLIVDCFGVSLASLNWTEWKCQNEQKSWIFETDSKYQENTAPKKKHKLNLHLKQVKLKTAFLYVDFVIL